MSNGFDAGGKGNGGKAKKSGLLDGLRSFGNDFAEAFARNMGAQGTTAPRSGKPVDPVIAHERPRAARQIHRTLNAQAQRAADEKDDAAPSPDEALAADGAAVDDAQQQQGADGNAADEAAGGNAAEAIGASADNDKKPEEGAKAADDSKQGEAGAEGAEKEDGGEGQDTTSVEDAKPSLSVAAKLKGVHRKIFRAAKTNAYKATKSGAGFTGSFGDFASWAGYPTAATAHPANIFLAAGGNGSIPKPSGSYTVGGGTCGASAHTKLWRAEVDKQRETIKKALIAKGQAPGVADRNAMKQLEADNGGMGFKDLYLLDNWEGHHIQPCNWGGTDVAKNIVFLKCTEHSPSTTWWEAKKSEILKLL